MGKYRDDPAAIAALIQEEQVHKDVYINQEIFDLEMERLFARTWIYVGHASQVPTTGDYITTNIAAQPVIMVRHTDGAIHVLMNRCSHKGSKLVSQPSGNTGRAFHCPYHAWAFKTDGKVLAIPARNHYEGTSLSESPAMKGLVPMSAVEQYRGFVFARISGDGPGFKEYFGDSLSSIDNMADRSPEGELEIAGGCLRYLHNCNWKMFVENLNDTAHPMVAHESSAGTAKKLWEGKPADTPKPMAIEQFVPFASGYQFFDDMGIRIFSNGHSYTGVKFSIHSSYSSIPGYEAQMVKAYGEERAKNILATARHNTVYYPTLTIKGAIQSIRVARPIGPDKTVLESYTFRLKGAPPELLQRTLMYTRLINSSMSVVGHDDLHAYRSIQEGLHCSGNDWVSLHRNYKPGEDAPDDQVVNGLSEIPMRGEFRTWARYMTTPAIKPIAKPAANEPARATAKGAV